MGRFDGAKDMAPKKTYSVDLADVLHDGRLTLPWRSLEDHERLSLLEVTVKQEGCGTQPGFISQVVAVEGGLTPRCHFEPLVDPNLIDHAGCGGSCTTKRNRESFYCSLSPVSGVPWYHRNIGEKIEDVVLKLRLFELHFTIRFELRGEERGYCIPDAVPYPRSDSPRSQA